MYLPKSIKMYNIKGELAAGLTQSSSFSLARRKILAAFSSCVCATVQSPASTASRMAGKYASS